MENETVHDESDAESLLREIACYLGVGGYNAINFDAKSFRNKIYEGIDMHCENNSMAARDLAEQVMHMDFVTDRGLRVKQLARKVLNIPTA